jgi:hypothetical protein
MENLLSATKGRKSMSGNRRYRRYDSNNSIADRSGHHTYAAETHLEGYEQGEAINAFLESVATDNDYLAMITQLVGLIYGEDSDEYKLLHLAMGVPDKKEPSVDDFKPSNARALKFRVIERFHRFLSEL